MVRISAVKPVRLLPLFVRRTFGVKDTAFFYTSQMTDNKYWTSLSYSSVKKGDIVSYTSYSHVVMITSYDGTTHKYSGHSNDRKNTVININTNTASNYKFYRVS